ncbi:MAG: hypothetical protein QOC82_2335 [Frankiaceae bacterium]|nr:hypothetical protein [Frankiaceae bacterium]
MTALHEHELAPGDAVAVVDDVDVDAEGTADLLKDADFEPIRVQLPETVEALLANLSDVARAVVCDHRLSQVVTVPYDGAQVAALCRERGLPAVLLTGYSNADEVASIRRWRDRIPRVLSKGTDNSPEAVAQALQLAQREVHGHFTPGRKAYRTIVRVESVDAGDLPLAEVFVSAWRPAEAVLVPATLLTEDTGLQLNELPGRRFLAEVNIYAPEQAELYFREFKLAAEPPPEWMA